jgi:hypothetical protein
MYEGREHNPANTVRYTEEVSGVLAVRLYSPRSCRSLIQQAKALPGWGAARVGVEEGSDSYGAAVEPETRLALSCTPTANSGVIREFNWKMNNVIKPVVKKFWGVSLKRHADTHLVRYIPGNFYAPHTDTGADVNDRYFTVLCYLNDSFRGGQTTFFSLNHSVQPQSGKAIVFPSTYVHSAEPVDEGEKYILVSWLIGAQPMRWI